MIVYLVVMSMSYYSTNIIMMPSLAMCEKVGNEIMLMDKKKKTIYKCVSNK